MPTPRKPAATSTGAKTSSGPTTRSATPNASGGDNAPGPEEASFKLPGMSDLKPAEQKMAEGITFVYGAVGTLVAVVPGMNDTGRAIQNLSEKIAVQWVILGRTNDSVRRWLVRATEASTSGGIITLHLMLILPILVANGVKNPVVGIGSAVATGDIPFEMVTSVLNGAFQGDSE